jgi:hypothetical protein
VLIVSETFIAAGYPDRVWKQPLSEFERLQVERIIKRKSIDGNISIKYAERITKAARDYRKTARPRVAEVYWEVECGGGGVTLKVVTNPPNATVTLMNELFHVVCTAQGVNPKSFSECNLFDEVKDGEETTFAGVYYYSVRWPDGKTQSATRKDFNKHRNSQVWVIRRSDI